VSAELRLSWRRGTGAFGLVAEIYPPLVEVIGRHLDPHPVAGEGPDAVLPHPSGGVGEDFVIVVELDPEITVREDFGDDAFEFEKFFLGQRDSPFAVFLGYPTRPSRERARVASGDDWRKLIPDMSSTLSD
jgi:hypothetical protein